MENRYIIANWKQNLNRSEIALWVKKFSELLVSQELSSNVKTLIAPSFVHLSVVSDLIKDHSNISCMAQDVSVFEGGSHTGEVSAHQLRDFCDKSLVGHSETGTSNEQALKKTAALLSSGIQPFLCFTDFAFIAKHTELLQIPLIWEDPSNISVEGQYRSKSADAIKQQCVDFKTSYGEAILLYGGSVNRQNATDLGNIAELDGVIVGNASLNPEHFFDIAKAFEI